MRKVTKCARARCISLCRCSIRLLGVQLRRQRGPRPGGYSPRREDEMDCAEPEAEPEAEAVQPQAAAGLLLTLPALDTALLELILGLLDARSLAAVGGCSRSLRPLAAAAAEASCARAAARCQRVGLLQRRPAETFTQLLAIVEEMERCWLFRGRRRLAAGVGHTVAVSPGGALFACGRNGSGQLGTGQTHDNGFEEFEESLCALPPMAAADGSSAGALAGAGAGVGMSGGGSGRPRRVIVCCSCGDESTVAVDEALRLYSWGHGHGSGSMTVPLPQLVEIDVAVLSVASGGQHVAAVDAEGRLCEYNSIYLAVAVAA
eukprot:COSAG06_NODE_4133_length_4538_cov_25.938107_3_plen_318_part_00